MCILDIESPSSPKLTPKFFLSRFQSTIFYLQIVFHSWVILVYTPCIRKPIDRTRWKGQAVTIFSQEFVPNFIQNFCLFFIIRRLNGQISTGREKLANFNWTVRVSLNIYLCFIPCAGKLISQVCQKGHIHVIFIDKETHLSPKQLSGFPQSRTQWVTVNLWEHILNFFLSCSYLGCQGAVENSNQS